MQTEYRLVDIREQSNIISMERFFPSRDLFIFWRFILKFKRADKYFNNYFIGVLRSRQCLNN